MSDTPEVMVRRWFDELWNQGREDTIDRMMAPNAHIFGLGGTNPIFGPEEFKPFFRRFRAAFPDIRITVQRTIAQGEFVAAYCHVKGTHLGDTLGTPATMRVVAFSGVSIAHVVDGRLIEGWNVFDFLSCYQQIGLLPQI
jgi:steroid delta-isomerase-like uncharacterized protein